MNSVDQLLAPSRNFLTALLQEKCERAVEFARQYSDDNQMQEAFSVAEMVMDFAPDETTIVAALLLKCADVDDPPFEDVERDFGGEVCQILRALHRLRVLTKVSVQNPDQHNDVLQKIFLSLAKDVRVVFLKLANRLYSLEHFDHVDLDEREQMASEVFDIYAPIAGKLGIFRLKQPLEDLAFRFLFPESFASLSSQLQELEEAHRKMLQDGEQRISEFLGYQRLKVEVESRVKSLYSIYEKLQRKKKSSLAEIYDVVAFRIIVDDIERCYSVLAHVHQEWEPVTDRFKDYIATPKPNGYESLHTTVVGLLNGSSGHYPIEIQIRTRQMHQNAEFGSAVHWSYKQSGSASGAYHSWIAQLAEQSKKRDSGKNFEIFAQNFLGEKVFVLTEKSDVKILPHGATPIDFAYAIHTQIGNTCQGALVNGKIVPLHHELHNGDVVKILTSSTVIPKVSWLQFAKSTGARQKIRSALRAQDHTLFVRTGREKLNMALKDLGKPLLDVKLSILKNFRDRHTLTLKERENILHRIGVGDLGAYGVAKEAMGINEADQKKKKTAPSSVANNGRSRVLVAGEQGFHVRYAKCCDPQKGDGIVAFLTRGGIFAIHQLECKTARRLDASRLLSARWSDDPAPEIFCLRIVCRVHHVQVVPEISECIVRNGGHLVRMNCEGKEIQLCAGFGAQADMEWIMVRMKEQNGVEEVLVESDTTQ